MENMERSREERAEAYFMEGYNCCQSVFLAFADRYGFDRETALRLSCSFGGGMARMRQVCGAVSAMALVVGLETGNTDPENQKAKKANYETMQELAEAFKKEKGSIICGELLKLTKEQKAAESPEPSLRTAEYYKKRPCVRAVGCAARILEGKFCVDK